MYPRYNIPQTGRIMQTRNSNNYNYPYQNQNNGDRFIGGGFIAPFLLGGIAGSLVSRPGYNYPPPPVIYYPPPTPYYSSSSNYYYY